ncbi:TRAP transporter small permease [Virgibacillus sp. FSP13]
MIKNLRKYLDRTLEFVTCTLLLIMVAVTTWQVITRYILHQPSAVTDEFLRFSLIWFSLLAGAYVVGKKSHIAITFLNDRLKDRSKRILDVIIQVSFIVFAIIMLFGGGKAVSLTMAQISPSLSLPMGYVYLSLPVSGVLIIFYSLINLMELFTNKNNNLTESA